MKITKQQTLTAIRRAERELDIEYGANVNHHRVFKNKKKYDRKLSKKITKQMLD
jgi:hypothetical protein